MTRETIEGFTVFEMKTNEEGEDRHERVRRFLSVVESGGSISLNQICIDTRSDRTYYF